MKIFVVEDDQEIALYIANVLNEKGYIVDVTANGQEGFMQARMKPMKR